MIPSLSHIINSILYFIPLYNLIIRYIIYYYIYSIPIPITYPIMVTHLAEGRFHHFLAINLQKKSQTIRDLVPKENMISSKE